MPDNPTPAAKPQPAPATTTTESTTPAAKTETSAPVTTSATERSDPTGTSTQARRAPSRAPVSELSGDDLLAAAQIKAPHIDRGFLSKHGLDDEYLRAVASGAEPPPPYNGPDTSATDLHLTPGGWQNVPAGVPPEDVGKDQVAR